MLRTFFFIGILLGALVGPWWFFPLSVFIYLFFYVGYELLMIALILDLAYGSANTMSGIPFVYTVACALCLVGMTYVRPYVRTM